MHQSSPRESIELCLLVLMEASAQYDESWSDAQLQDYLQQIRGLKALAQKDKLRGVSYLSTLVERYITQNHLLHKAIRIKDCAILSSWPAILLTEIAPPPATDVPDTWESLQQLLALDGFEALTPESVLHIESRLAEDAALLSVAASDVQGSAEIEPEQPEPSLIVDALPTPLMASEAETTPLATPAASLPGDVATRQSALPEPVAQVAQVAQDELDMLVSSLAEMERDVLPLLATSENTAAVASGLLDYEQHLNNLLNAADHLSLTGLSKLLQTLVVNVAMLQGDADALPAPAQHLLVQSVASLQSYCADPADSEKAEQLAVLMTDEAWPYATDSDTALAWCVELMAVQVIDTRLIDTGPTLATAQDVDLTIPSDIESTVLNSLLDELPHHAHNFSQVVQRFELAQSLEDLEEARKIAHTLKGAGNTAGIKGIGNLTHVIEEVLLAFGRAQQMPSAELNADLIEAADCLEEMSESLISQDAAPAQALSVYQKILDWIQRINNDGVQSLSSEQVHTENEPVPAQANLATAEAHELEASLRVPVSLVESLLGFADEDAIVAAQMQERITRLTQELTAQKASARQFRQLAADLEQLVDVRGLSMMGGGSHGLDSLEMDQYNELHILTRRIVEASADGREFIQTIDADINSLRDLSADKERILTKMQNGIQRTRMVPVSSVSARLQRAVRQAARVLGRSVQLNIQGEETLMDTQLLNSLLDALMHLLRNAVDHGIEPEAERIEAGKPALGTIELAFRAVGSSIHIDCSDDGKGFNLAQIKHKAQEAGLIAADAQLSDDQIRRLILRSGFSTREQVTHISGRGLGMSIVNQAVVQLRGSLEISSPADQGSRFSMRFPVQFSAKQVMMSRSEQHRIALSERGLAQLLPVDARLLIATELGMQYQHGDLRLPVRRLDHLLGLPTYALRDAGELETIMLVINHQQEQVAVIGPELSESRRVIVKPVGEFVPAIGGIDGIAILGDGAICTVIDLPDLLLYASDNAAAEFELSAPTAAKSLPICLVVDDSVSVRRTMEHLMQDAGYLVISARDGLDALALLERFNPQVALVDLEMPRMNGLDLTKSMRNRPQTKRTPVIMITSRFTDRHRELAREAGVNEFLTKPYSDDALLGMVQSLTSTAA
jgi:chemotaxis protein histidine kinase CheA/CheY-like chemotaxis protein